MRSNGLLALIAATGVFVGSPDAGAAQGFRPSIVAGYSAPAPASLRGELTSSGAALGSAADGGPFVSVGLERGADLGVRMEAVYSRHASPELHYIGPYGNELLFAAEREETVGLMTSLLVPLVRVADTLVRVSASAGVLRTELQGFATSGGDAGSIITDSQTAPALGLGLEVPVSIGRGDLLIKVRGAQLLSEERGGGYVTAGVGLRL